jgi:hypothetical protein
MTIDLCPIKLSLACRVKDQSLAVISNASSSGSP